ncbi:MAG: DUF1822 family protein [Richelia sp. RM2_1_2]|nr:DUF1822 family protein [Richelia sp. SM2_1_7]NJM20967.1 DUF1822 family protein [Richelia sp. SM1_7_0]NJN10261.1 DUF1822 family protein [Richelia sp. RM1_1_1]NJO26101.1 DUF1822 family protein [Richelia sp. SL_2_1]NJO60646.1 DUF1822 family protein [Richelia sp. RM2_1_2]
MPNSIYSQDLRLLLPETVWLEQEHFLLANQISSSQITNATDAWQVYLNTLALIALEVWLQERLPNQVVLRDINFIATAGNLTVDEYKFCAIATEHLLSETVMIPQQLITNPELSAHFYVVLEVLEEQEEVLVRGFLSHNKLVEVKSNLELSISDGCYQVPLSLFDIEPNHLLLYQHYVQAAEFAVPIVKNEVTQVSENISKILHSTTTKLSQWLQGVVDEGWQTIDSIYNPELNLAFSTRNIDKDTKRAKIIDLGIDLGNQKVTLLLNISPVTFSAVDSNINNSENQDKISVLAQLYPMSGERFLPHNIKLILLSKAGKVLQEVTSRIQDNYIQLKPFKGEAGKKFSIQISLGDISIKEDFEF